MDLNYHSNIKGPFIKNANVCSSVIVQCAVPEKIHSHPMEGRREFPGGGGSSKAKYEAKQEFPGGGGVQNKKPSMEGKVVWILFGTARCM